MPKIKLKFMEKYKEDEETITEHETANALVLYRKYAIKKAMRGKDFKLFSDWIEDVK